MRLTDADKFVLALMDASLSSVDEDTILDLVDSIHTVDAVPVVHGRWIEREDPMLDTYYTCSACNEDFYIEPTGDTAKDLFTYTYCPNCGAKMDKKVATHD